MEGKRLISKGGLASAIALLVTLSLSPFTLTQTVETQDELRQESLPVDPMMGRIVFEEKQCIDCHAIDGFGGEVGPDLGRERFFGSFYNLTARLWNHAPQMTIQADFREKEWPTLTTEEMEQLISYLFYLRYLGEPGNVSEGKELLREKNCLKCHRVGREGASDGIELDRLQEYASPLYVAQVIWNHGPEMQERMAAMGIERPMFGDRDITDISAYLRELSREESRRRQYMSPGNPKAGAAVFKEKGCSHCHATRPDQASEGVSLGDMDLHRSVTDIAGTMWNHGNIMRNAMKSRKVKWPTFQGSEMADLIAYLYFYDYQNVSPGDPKRGGWVFEKKSCATCHAPGQPHAFAGSIFLATPTDLVRTMWNHVPYMHELIVTKDIEWPKLTEEDLRHLYSYLLHLTPGE
ncbi:MAG: cytochrome c [Candidatus Neomarinimicrobiota bacterium]